MHTPNITINIPTPCVSVIFSFKTKQDPTTTNVFTIATESGIAMVKFILLTISIHKIKLKP